ncbi:unnamed protein product (macronuclear) [Paramecium tetraurelia]|uniref:PWWP domain-containing protein n=1 Tax=Paramecium tetraurelia TaxID=5888 RepID=A0BDL0_PARTE|nr:uncharacterized protein GSPATT00027656001 [Paramecium tetraurelia]CAK56627.1 unnamed protein product [Paramecium tetraurelia]|eukprot:XP_001424025.1 hypothetical protein (macronuclear) [Paramecium tetraurelia strain d4-2]
MQFNKNDVFWGKIQGYPYWPCTIAYDQPDKQKCRVFFFGDNQQGELKYQDLKPFEEHFEHYCSQAKKNNNLKISIEQAINKETHKHLLPIYEKIVKGTNHSKVQESKQSKNNPEIKIQSIKQSQPKKIEIFIQKHFKDVKGEVIQQILEKCNNNDKKVVKAIKAYSSLQAGIVNKIFNFESFENYYDSSINIIKNENYSMLTQLLEPSEIKIFF